MFVTKKVYCPKMKTWTSKVVWHEMKTRQEPGQIDPESANEALEVKEDKETFNEIKKLNAKARKPGKK